MTLVTVNNTLGNYVVDTDTKVVTGVFAEGVTQYYQNNGYTIEGRCLNGKVFAPTPSPTPPPGQPPVNPPAPPTTPHTPPPPPPPPSWHPSSYKLSNTIDIYMPMLAIRQSNLLANLAVGQHFEYPLTADGILQKDMFYPLDSDMVLLKEEHSPLIATQAIQIMQSYPLETKCGISKEQEYSLDADGILKKDELFPFDVMTAIQGPAYVSLEARMMLVPDSRNEMRLGLERLYPQVVRQWGPNIPYRTFDSRKSKEGLR